MELEYLRSVSTAVDEIMEKYNKIKGDIKK